MEPVDIMLGSGSTEPPGGVNDSNHSTPFWSEVDSRWCYVVGKPHVCVRISIMLLLGIIAGAVCLARIVQYHCYKARNYHQYLVYYIALLICILSIVHWGYLVTTVLDLIITYLIIVQILVVSLFFCSWAFRILQQERLFNCLILPALFGVLLYFTGCLIWASVTTMNIKVECAEPQWLLFSSSQLVLVQFFLISVIYITKKLNDIRTMRINRCSQKAQLWGLAVVYELVSLGVFAYDIYFMVTKSLDHQCGTQFDSNPVGSTVMYIAHKLLKYFVPQFAICVVFEARSPSIQQEIEETDTLSWAGKSNYQSTFYSHGNNTIPENREYESIIPYSINTSMSTNPILPRTISSSSSYTNSPWIIPGRSWINSAANTASPQVPYGTKLPQGQS